VSVKKKKHVRQEAAPTAATAAIDVDANAAPSNSTPTVVPADLLADGRKKRKPRRKLVKNLRPMPHLPLSPLSSMLAIAEDASTKMRRKGKKAQIIQKETYPEPNLPTTSDGITKDELKQKRRGESGKKKKDKVLRRVGGVLRRHPRTESGTGLSFISFSSPVVCPLNPTTGICIRVTNTKTSVALFEFICGCWTPKTQHPVRSAKLNEL